MVPASGRYDRLSLAQQSVEEPALAGVGRADQNDARQSIGPIAAFELFRQFGEVSRRVAERGRELAARNRVDVGFVDEIETRFEMGQGVEPSIAHLVERRGQSAGELAQSRLELGGIGGLDDAQDGLGLGQVDPAGQERAQRELTRLGEAGASFQTVGEDSLARSKGAVLVRGIRQRLSRISFWARAQSATAASNGIRTPVTASRPSNT